MSIEKAVSEEILQRLMSEIVLLRKEVQQAERDQIASLTSAVEVALGRVVRKMRQGAPA